MFSSQINSRDLFFSNPVDHFLGNNGGLKTSGESGFSSSNYSQNRSFSQNRNSKDLMDTNNSYDIFSQSQKTNAGEVQGSADYQKYISQNLLFGKAKKGKGKQNFKSFENDDSEQQEERLVLEDNHISSEMTEIKNLLGGLAGGIRKIHSDLTAVQGSIRDVETEISKQNERISSIDESLNNQAKTIEELDKQYKKGHKKDDIMKFQNLINENTDEIKQELNRLEDMIKKDFQTGKLMETVKKLTTAQSNGNKKVLEDTKIYNERILKRIDAKIDKHCNEFKTFLETVKNGDEKNMEKEIEDMKEGMKALLTSVKHLVDNSKTSQAPNEFQDSMFKTPAAGINDSQKPRSSLNNQASLKTSICTQNSVHTPLANSFNQTEFPFKKKNKENTAFDVQTENEFDRLLFTNPQRSCKLRSNRATRDEIQMGRPNLCSQNSVHTPLASQIENSFSFKQQSKESTQCKSERSLFKIPQLQNIPTKYQRLRSRLNQRSANVSGPVPNTFHTPLAKSLSQSEASFPLRYMNQANSKENANNKQSFSKNYAFNIKRKMSPDQSPRFGRSPNYSSKFTRTVRESQIYQNPNAVNQQNYKNSQQKDYENDTLTQKSSPYLTVYEIATLAEEFIG